MVQITISTAKGDVIQLDVDSAEHIENVKALVEVETGIPLQQQVVFFNGKQLLNSNQLDKVGVKNGDLLFVQINQTASRGAPQGAQQQSIDPVEFQNYVKSNPQILQQLLHSNPPLAEAVLSDDLTLLTNLLSQQDQARRQAEAERLRKIEAMNADPLNPEYQKLIAEEIRMENINENMETAMEHIPESFARVVMLYIDCQVNNTPVKAFVDSGAQQTIMSVQCAERCGIMRLVDTRYQGIAKGVGTAKIVGRVHLAPIKIGNNFFPCSFTILEDRSMEFLLGLDMLRRHQCAIDLKDNVLRIGDEKVPFLAEKDIPLSELFSGQDALDSEGMNPTSVSNNPPKPTPTPTPAPSTTAPKPASIPQLAPQPQPQMQPQNRPTPVSFPEDTITQLMGLGFTRDEVVNALRQTRGNADAAASLLFGGGF